MGSARASGRRSSWWDGLETAHPTSWTRSDADQVAPGPRPAHLRVGRSWRRHTPSRKGGRGTRMGGLLRAPAAVHQPQRLACPRRRRWPRPGSRTGPNAPCEGRDAADGRALRGAPVVWPQGRTSHRRFGACGWSRVIIRDMHGALHPPPNQPDLPLQRCRPSARTRCTAGPQGNADGKPDPDVTAPRGGRPSILRDAAGPDGRIDGHGTDGAPVRGSGQPAAAGPPERQGQTGRGAVVPPKGTGAGLGRLQKGVPGRPSRIRGNEREPGSPLARELHEAASRAWWWAPLRPTSRRSPSHPPAPIQSSPQSRCCGPLAQRVSGRHEPGT